jgi:hypothetical protein
MFRFVTHPVPLVSVPLKLGFNNGYKQQTRAHGPAIQSHAFLCVCLSQTRRVACSATSNSILCSWCMFVSQFSSIFSIIDRVVHLETSGTILSTRHNNKQIIIIIIIIDDDDDLDRNSIRLSAVGSRLAAADRDVHTAQHGRCRIDVRSRHVSFVGRRNKTRNIDLFVDY